MVRKRHRSQKTSVSKVPMEINVGAAKEVAAVLVILVLAAIPFCYGKYIEFNINGAFDGALNLYSAQCVADGQKVGVDVFPSARPATLLVNVVGVWLFGYSETGPKIIQLLMQVGAIGLMYYTVRRLYGILPAGVAVFLAAFYLSCPPFAKTGNAKEQFMIACMIVTACAFILNQYGGKWWWLLLSGATGINIYYFKPTGVSVLIAIIVFIAAQPLLKRRMWKEAGRDIVLFAAGTVFGLVPLMMFYLWQGRLYLFMKKFPASLVKNFICLFIVYGVVVLAYRIAIKVGGEKVFNVIKKVPWRIVVCLMLVFLLFLVLTVLFGGEGPESFTGKLLQKPVLEPCIRVVYRVLRPIRLTAKAIFNSQTGYLAGSRSVSDFSTQFARVMGHYRSFVVPIGLSLVAIVWWMAGVFAKLFKKRGVSDGEDVDGEGDSDRGGVDRFVLLLAVWWILDMAFVWVSPRAYVEYLLPLNGSAAMLAGYTIYKCREKPWGWCCVLAAWLLVDQILVRSLGGAAAEGIVIKLVVIAGSVGIWFGAKKLKMPMVVTVLLFLVCFGTWYQWNGVNLKAFGKKAEGAKQVYPWEQLSYYIRDNSAKNDGVYVWGWLPGIYVQSQRFSPTKRNSAYSDMHTERPGVLKQIVEKVVEELKADPPKYIVDSQKIHFPYYRHPVFDLWPSWEDRSRGRVHMRVTPSQRYDLTKAFSADEVKRYQSRVLDYVEGVTHSILTDSRRKGGALVKDGDRANAMARNERERHAAMMPLQDFVVENYRIVPINAGGHVLFERKGSAVR